MMMLVSLMFLVALVFSVHADGPGDLSHWLPVFRQNFLDMDTNKDGKVTFQEFLASYTRDDQNGDGKITLQEYLHNDPLQENQAALTQDFKFVDVNHDGVIDQADALKRFQSIDTNNDESIQLSEFVKFASLMFTTQQHPAFGK